MRSIKIAAFSCLLASGVLSAGQLIRVTSIPNRPYVTAMVRDNAGNLYIGGSFTPAAPKSAIEEDPFVAKLSEAGAVLFWTTLSDGAQDQVNALAFAPDGSILATGAASSLGFPVTSNAAEKTNTAGTNGETGFLARPDSSGSILYSSYLNGAPTYSASPMAIAVDSSGAAYITGVGIFESTPGAVPAGNPENTAPGAFIVKLDSNGKTVFATGAMGGSGIALDSSGNIYVVGADDGEFPMPITPGAYQSGVVPMACGGTFQIGFPCFHQYVAKLNPAATKLLYVTWLSGTYGDGPSSIVANADGTVILAGSTESTDYPVTTGAFQTSDGATPPPLDITDGLIVSFPSPPSTGYVTKLNAEGSALIFSTFFGGSGQDSIGALSVDAHGDLNLAGSSQSPDLPGLGRTPSGCRGNSLYAQSFTAQMTGGGGKLLGTQLASGPLATFVTAAVFFGHGLASLTTWNPTSDQASLSTASLFAPASPFVCAVDAADLAPLSAVASGQLMMLFGNGIGGGAASVKIHGIAAPILYSSPNQINIQAPYEISTRSRATLEIDGPSGEVAGSRTYVSFPASRARSSPPSPTRPAATSAL